MTWPKEILVCPDCGVIGWGHLARCRSVDEPKQTFPVIPAPIAEELAAALERAMDCIEAPGDSEILDNACFALQSYHAALGEETE